ncbi:hypothetical protein Hdeb2414_s0018g00519091 [Helianthus debilis subsp. tardiflorus]
MEKSRRGQQSSNLRISTKIIKKREVVFMTKVEQAFLALISSPEGTCCQVIHQGYTPLRQLCCMCCIYFFLINYDIFFVKSLDKRC